MSQLQKDLEALYHLFDDKKRWTTQVNARDARGIQVSAESEHAASWCVFGGALKLTDDNPRRWELILKAISEECPENYGEISTNDSLGYAAIRRAIRKAIKKVSA